MNIVVKDNAMADILSQAFKYGKISEVKNLTSYFNSHLNIPHIQSWKEYMIPAKVALIVISCLRGDQFLMESLRKLPVLGVSIGVAGMINARNSEQCHNLTQSRPVNKLSS